AEVRLRGPEPDVVVHVVDVAQDGRVARDGVGRIAGDVDGGQVRGQGADEVRGAGLVRAAFEVEQARLALTRLDERRAGAERAGRERPGDAAVGVVEEDEGVVVDRAVVGRVEGGDLDVIGLAAGREGLQFGRLLKHRTVRHLPQRGELSEGGR